MLQIENLQRGRPTCPQRNTFSLLIHIGIGHAAALISRYHLSHVPRPMGGQTPALTSACTNPKPEGQSEIIKNEITRPTISSDRAKKKSFGSFRLRAVRGHKSTPIRRTLTGPGGGTSSSTIDQCRFTLRIFLPGHFRIAHCRNTPVVQANTLVDCRGVTTDGPRGVGAVFGCISVGLQTTVGQHPTGNDQKVPRKVPFGLAPVQSGTDELALNEKEGCGSSPLFLPNDLSFNSPKWVKSAVV